MYTPILDYSAKNTPGSITKHTKIYFIEGSRAGRPNLERTKAAHALYTVQGSIHVNSSRARTRLLTNCRCLGFRPDYPKWKMLRCTQRYIAMGRRTIYLCIVSLDCCNHCSSAFPCSCHHVYRTVVHLRVDYEGPRVS